MQRSLRIYILSCICLLALCCQPVDRTAEHKLPALDKTYRSQVAQDAYDYGDRRLTDTIISQLRSEKPIAHYQAARIIQSFYDSSFYQAMIPHVRSPYPAVRDEILYAIGQSHDGRFIAPLIRMYRDTSITDLSVRQHILEAISKVGGQKEMDFLSSVQTFQKTDTHLIIGLSRALYDLQLRGHKSDQATKMIFDLVFPSGVPEAELAAAHYLGRARSLDLKPYEGKIREIAFTHPNPEIRIPIARAFKHIQNDFGYQSLLDWYLQEKDYRVRTEIVRSAQTFDNKPVHTFLNDARKDKNIHVALTAAQFLIEKLPRADALKMRQSARASSTSPPQLQAALYTIANRNLSNAYGITKVNMNDEIKERYKKNKNAYDKAAFLRALSYWPGNIDYILNEYSAKNPSIINTTITEVLLNQCGTDIGKKIYSGYQGTLRQKLGSHFLKIFDQHDVGSMTLAAEHIAKEPRKWNPYFRDYAFLEKSLERLDLPKEYETYLSVIKAINAVSADQLEVQSSTYNHPIDWELVSTLADTTLFTMKTTKGDIQGELYTLRAPGSVSNWVQLARSDFFDNKYFHRVVADFVIQSGCPRGDGYGSLDYNIRSEFSPLRYESAGVIGMASAGPDTEGTQWFITHSATPHLNGRYTIIGRVTDGLDIVHKIVQGDVVQDVIIE